VAGNLGPVLCNYLKYLDILSEIKNMGIHKPPVTPDYGRDHFF